MSVYSRIQHQLKECLSKSPSEEELKKFISTVLHQQSPKQAFHQVNLHALKQPTILFTRLMVQDIRQSCYSSPLIVQKPFNENSKIYLFKYGHKHPEFDYSILKDPNYFSFLEDQETVACVPVVGETEWVRQIEKNQLKQNQIFEMVVDKVSQLKLGEIFSAICLYQPEDKQLFFIRKATQNQIKEWDNLEVYLNKQINFQQERQKLLNSFRKLYSEKYSLFLLYSLLSTEHFFISALENHSPLFKKLLPRVCEVKIQAPFKESLFPYKNEDQVLIRTQMQMSHHHTYVILDFSHLSSESEVVKIGPQEIDNIKALKVFVEEGNTIYRWLYGQSLVPHEHTGVVVKASSVVCPQYVITEKNKEQKAKIPEIQEMDLATFRRYIHQVRKINALLKDDRKEIEEKIHSQTIKFDETSLVKVMELSKLNARSYGREEIKTEDFESSCSIFF